jgi:hypothetical protein
MYIDRYFSTNSVESCNEYLEMLLLDWQQNPFLGTTAEKRAAVAARRDPESGKREHGVG